VDVLGLVALEEQIGGGADNVGMRIGGKEKRARLGHLDNKALAPAPAAPGPGVAQPIGQSKDRVDRLRLKGRAGLDDRAAAALEKGQEVRLELPAELVLARLAGHHDGEREAAAADDAVQDGAGGLNLVLAQGALADDGGKGVNVGQPMVNDRVDLGSGWGVGPLGQWAQLRAALEQGADLAPALLVGDQLADAVALGLAGQVLIVDVQIGAEIGQL
jgi:hypothetical protein